MRTISYALGVGLALSSSLAFAIDRDASQMELSQAISALQVAQRDDAAQFAPRDYDEAQAMLASAQTAADHRDWTETAIYAERAKVAADLASARSRQTRAESATAELERSVDSLRAQISVTRGNP